MSKKKQNLKRLLAPKHIAFIGGNDAAFSARQCAEHFSGAVWGVNPKRDTLGGQVCYARVCDLPEAPDAVFLATPRHSTTRIIQELNDMGAGGVACFTAGYGELGEDGRLAEAELIAAAGDLALVGPNCYGLISYVNKAILWPFGAGSPQGKPGVALIMQSGMIAANLIMNQRSVPFAYVISAGNQSVLAIEDYIDALSEDPAVKAIGLYIEGIKDIQGFANAAIKSLRANKPIVVLKAGTSVIGSQLTISHTGSLSGTDDAYNALFDELGIVRVDSPEAMLETLKFVTISGLPKGNRLFAFTCSGGDSAMVADYCEKLDLTLTAPTTDQTHQLTKLLPDIATVSNPLDYTTPLWGNAEILPHVFHHAMNNHCDMAIFIQDYPPKDIHEDNTPYVTDGVSFMQAATSLGIPAGICSDLAENIDSESRQRMVDYGVTPMQGIDRGLAALADAWWLSQRREHWLSTPESIRFGYIPTPPNYDESVTLNEFQSKEKLSQFGIAIPDAILLKKNDRLKDQIFEGIPFPVALKAVSALLPHKTELDAVRLNLHNQETLEQALDEMRERLSRVNLPDNNLEYLVESMIDPVVCELLVGVRRDPQFGPIMVIASGGVFVELIRDSQTLLLPSSKARMKTVLSRLACYPLIRGFRGQSGGPIDLLVDTLYRIGEFAEVHARNLIEMDINPLIVTPTNVYAADALVRFETSDDD